MPRTRTHIARILLVAVTLAIGSVYGYYYGREWAAKWAFAHQTEFGIEELVRIAIPQSELNAKNDFLIQSGRICLAGRDD